MKIAFACDHAGYEMKVRFNGSILRIKDMKLLIWVVILPNHLIILISVM